MKIFFSGDVFCNKKIKLNIDNYLKEVLSVCDYACFNLEGPLKTAELKKSAKRGPSLLNDDSIPMELKRSGFNIVTLANNHIMDYGVDGLKNTITILEREEFATVGAGLDATQAYRYLALDADVKVGIVSVAEKQFGPCVFDEPGFAWMYKEDVYRQIRKAVLTCDAVIVLCHCGAENINIPLPEVRELYKQFVDFGADIVIGNHPHVIQGSEKYKGKEIFYSLGNMIWPIEKDTYINSLGIMVDIKNKYNIICDVFELYYNDGCLGICKEKEQYDQAVRDLNDNKYIKRINEYCLNYYEDLKRYYGLIIGFDVNDKDKQKLFFKYREMGAPLLWDNLFVYHNISIETNRWIAERAISLLKGLMG